MATEDYEVPLANLHDKKISFIQFLQEVDCYKQFKKWCKAHYLIEDEGAAQCFFDHYGFEESIVEKAFIMD